jgi:hypothetical protein
MWLFAPLFLCTEKARNLLHVPSLDYKHNL